MAFLIRGLGSAQRFLCSQRVVATEIALLVALCMAGGFIPQQGSVAHAQWQQEHPALASIAGWTWLDTVYTSPQFLVLLALIGLGAVLSMATRIKTFLNENGGRVTLRDVLERQRLWGSLLFHAGLVGVLVAGVVSTLTRSEGSIILTEGQSITLDSAQLSNRIAPRLDLKPAKPFQVRLDKFHPVHDGRWGSPDYASDVTVVEADGREGQSAYVHVNEPLKHRGVTIYQTIHGFSPLLDLRDSSGRHQFYSWVSLSTELSEEEETRYRDEFAVPGTTLTIEAEFFPDSYMMGDRLASRSPDPKNPALAVTVRDGVDTIYNGPVYLGEPVELASGLWLEMAGVRYWSGFDVVRDLGAGALFISAWVAIAGLGIRFVPLRGMRLQRAK